MRYGGGNLWARGRVFWGYTFWECFGSAVFARLGLSVFFSCAFFFFFFGWRYLQQRFSYLSHFIFILLFFFSSWKEMARAGSAGLYECILLLLPLAGGYLYTRPGTNSISLRYEWLPLRARETNSLSSLLSTSRPLDPSTPVIDPSCPVSECGRHLRRSSTRRLPDFASPPIP